MGNKKNWWRAIGGLWVLTVALILISSAPSGAGRQSRADGSIHAGDYRLAGPYTHENLTVWMIHGDGAWAEAGFLTLREALERGQALVSETGSVNELVIENLCVDEPIVVLSGDIVKGGKQDRTVVYDFVLEPGSGPQPVPVHCVESGRGSRRGDEDVGGFGSAMKALAGKAIKLGNRGNADGAGQSKVWAGVSKFQAELSNAIDDDVQDGESASSLQLSLENEKVQVSFTDYKKAIARGYDANPGAIGFVFAIDGELNSAEVFGSARLFRRVWPRLLEAAAVEAIGTGKRAGGGDVSADALRELLTGHVDGRFDKKKTNPRTEERVYKYGEHLLFETVDLEGGRWLRRNYFANADE